MLLPEHSGMVSASPTTQSCRESFGGLRWMFRVSGLKLWVQGPRNSGYGTRNFRNGTTKAYAWEEAREEVGLLKRLVFPRHGI